MLCWLCYRRAGQFQGAAIVEATDKLHARMRAAVSGLDPGFEFDCEIFELATAARRHIPKRFFGRLLDRSDLAKLERLHWQKKPPARSVRRRVSAKRKRG